ncbi:hypothetical protein BB934_32110 (plasmid) [Microvirga ossetica]|uniref:DUF2243 domain-containing protein n=1 Tax=Microvirga ossetica TaxID=1882682 RepID=A0A1B2ETI1_9HYPH|nr:DUF2243 domain-containing protein [Microvirga ossetica]ANY83288.1 hypothetical protein BB934_32110 [Microvirga ossetica]
MIRTDANGRYRWSGYLLGFALGGFFDGILLHQILQWHHLLSAINSMDIRFQVAADGYFHAFMYVIAVAGLWLLWASRKAPDRPAGRLLLATILIGFGAWHVVDAVLSHWVLGIHRIRMDSGSPLIWDLLWFGIFGVMPLVIGWLRNGTDDDDRMQVSRSATVVRLLAGLLVIGAGAQALRPAPDNGFTTVLFAPGISQERIFRGIGAVDGRVAWTDGTGELVVIRIAAGQSRHALFRHGAILVSGAGFPAGCFDYLTTG